MSTTMSVECDLHIQKRAKGRKTVASGQTPKPVCEAGRVPRVAKLLALAHRFETLVREGAVRDYAELARLGRVTRARVTQVMNLLLLAPDIQEEILFLPRLLRGRERIQLHALQPIALTPDWKRQRKMWRQPTSS